MAASYGVTAAHPSLISPAEIVALAGVDTPLTDLSLSAASSQRLAVIISAQTGTLYADPAAGGAIGGGGSNSLWISGSAAEVKSELSTIVYQSTGPGVDELSVTVLDGSGTIAPPIVIPVDVLSLALPPTPADAIVMITAGTLTLDTRVVDGPGLFLSETPQSSTAPTAVLVNSTLGSNTALTVVDQNGLGQTAPRVAIAGQVALQGSTTFSGGPALMTLAIGSVLTNSGQISFQNSAAEVTGNGALLNNGTIDVTGAAAAATLIDVTMTGTGTVSLTSGATLEIGQGASAGSTVEFNSLANATLLLDAPSSFAAAIAGFTAGDQIELPGLDATNAIFTPDDFGGGTLSLSDGAQPLASLHVLGVYAPDGFQVSNLSGASGVSVTLAPAVAQSTTIESSTAQDVYRFFDTATGAQLLTQSAAERHALDIGRPDLIDEGIAFKALNPATTDPDAITVFRFFDVDNGTHFYTASVAEEHTILATRPDLTLEPGSTLVEYATPTAGSVPVYRFFDATNGSHFFTADAGERAAILSTRPDMLAEGIAFYAPTNA